MELLALGLAVLLALLFAFYCGKLAWQSHAFNDISTGNDATPLWIPQLTMAWGALIFAVAFIDEAVLEIQNRRVVPVSGEALRNE
jgi:TRAP-type C4-dicarboxylate transport system permease small subunit